MKLVMIHGIGQENITAAALRKIWLDALVKGGADPVRLATARPEMAYYGRLLAEGRDEAGPGIRAKAVFKAEAMNLIGRIPNTLLHSLTSLPLQGDAALSDEVLAAIAAGRTFQQLPWVSELLDQVYDYLTKPNLRARIDAEVDKAFVEGADVVIGHSLGSVIAYRALKRRAAAGKSATTRLVTLGSPLGFPVVRSVMTRIGPGDSYSYPAGLGDWRNFYDRFDVIALGQALPKPAGANGRVTSERVDNLSFTNHDDDKYLALPDVAAAVMQYL